MISIITNDKCYEFRGLSTDTKPIGSNCSNANVDYIIGNGSIFLEMDKSEVFSLSIKLDDTTGKYVGTWLMLGEE